MFPTQDLKVLVPQPRCRVLRVYANGDGRSIQELMGLEDDAGQFKEITRYILNRCRCYNVDTHVRFSLQDPDVLMKVKEKTREKFPMLRKYEDGWPIIAYLKRELKRRKGPLCIRKESFSYPGNQPRSQSRMKPASRERPGKFPTSTPPRHSTRVNRAFVLVPPQKRTSIPATSVPDGSSEKAREGPQVPSNTYGNTPNSIKGPQNTRPVATQDPVMTAPSPSNPSNTVLGWIVSFNIPLADARRIAELFASFGIGDMAYLRALARMESRDAWLREMRDNGELSEIQMRILRDMLERLAAQWRGPKAVAG